MKLEERLTNKDTTQDEIIIKYLKKAVRLTAGASFGEISLILSKPRSATVKAVWDCDLACLSKEQFIETMGSVQEIQINKVESLAQLLQKLDILRKIPLFNDYSKSFRVKILNFMEIMNAKKGEALYLEGKEAKNIYFIVSGEFEATKKLVH